MWLLRLGYYRLHESVEPADDWFYMLDHAIQMGRHRFLGIIGIRLSTLPRVGECLKLKDMRVIALLPVEKRLKDDGRWCGFIKQATQTKFQTLQTELAFLVPPALKSKARYMNLQSSDLAIAGATL